jgi:hypothetical protein
MSDGCNYDKNTKIDENKVDSFPLPIYSDMDWIGYDSSYDNPYSMERRDHFMKTYQFESIIQDNGSIPLPSAMRNLKHHRVKLILIDLEQREQNPVERLADITQRYTMLDEADIDMTDLYIQRTQHHDRGLVFD